MSIKVSSLDFAPSIVVEVEDPHGNKSRIEFKRKLARDSKLELADVIRKVEESPQEQKNEPWLDYMNEQLVSIEGLKQDGKPVTIDMVKRGEVFAPILALIQKCFVASVNQDLEDESKKDSALAV